MKIRLVTVVWGREFVEIFLRIGLRTLLSDGNAPALARAHQVTFTIYTTPEDRQLLEAEPAFARLREAVNVQYSLFSLSEIDSANPSSHGIFWYRAIALARRRSEVLFFIMPDILYARGTLLAWARRFENGARAVFTVGPRVALETALPELEARFPARQEPCGLSREELLELLYRHFHPLNAIMRRDSLRRFAHPEYDLRVVPGQGVIIRDMVSHPFCLDPGYFSNLRYFAPEDHLESLAFEPCSTVSVEPLLKFVDQWYRPWPLDEIRLSNLGGWWDWHTTRSCERESELPFELLLRPGADGTPHSERNRAIAAGRFYRSQVVIAGRLYKLFVALRERGFHQAASLLAAAVYAGCLRRRISLRRGAILLVPTDVAFEADRARIRELLLPERERELLDLVGDHVVLEQDELRASRRWRKLVAQSTTPGLDVRPLFTARGERADTVLSTLAYMEPFSLGPFTIYPVDRVLWRDRIGVEPAAVTACDPASSSGVAAELPDAGEQWRSNGSSLDGAPSRALHRCRLLLRASARRGIAALAAASRRATLMFEDLPLIGRLTHLCTRILQSILRDGPAVTLRRIALRLGIADLVALPRRQSEPSFRLARTAIHAVRRYGLSVTMRKAVDRATVAASEKIKPPITPPGADAEILDEVRRWRALQAAEQVMADFVQRLDIRDLPSIPLAFVREKLDELAKVGCAPPSEMLAARLRELTEKHPAWAEAWLELGFLHQDEGRSEQALDCFECAMRGRLSDTADRRHNPIAIAAANRGRLLTATGRHAEALASFAFCLRHHPEQSMVSVEYADALRRAGQPDAALVYYAQGMYYRPPIWNLPRLSRNAADMTFGRLASKDATLADAVVRVSIPCAGPSTPGAAVEAVN
jgi:tetratricopeptide (TPR) repeat protein